MHFRVKSDFQRDNGSKKRPKGWLEKLEPSNDEDPLADCEKALRAAAQSLVDYLQQLYEDSVKYCAIIYFDEVHTLFSPQNGQDKRTPYYALMHVLSMLHDKRIFFVFLSTNSSLQTFAPTGANYPSIRVQNNSKLIPPFFKLPFDTFSRNFTAQAMQAGKLTLSGVCELEQMAKFGRPLWFSYYQSLPEAEKEKMIDLAVKKLEGSGTRAHLAALDARVLIDFDPFHPQAYSMQTKLMKSNLRCIFNIPKEREYIHSRYPSEPVLSEAAGHTLNLNVSIVDTAPEILMQALTTGLLAKDERASGKGGLALRLVKCMLRMQRRHRILNAQKSR
ncbi:hypothetical protein E1B28_011010 [Marasmius oreades]|uniref:Uncharacterized protein n=1 Tax=Marasmius oreades TaxID=181124 RepID=A0A9P7UPR9_9AGAR|nr:uncharacterized protein E1B28_011010 [Marasmius oreades]KAG7089315.1 hypothetical protein E1B28_011010 [Marasmius oreades]